jgi:hypothetical protein
MNNQINHVRNNGTNAPWKFEEDTALQFLKAAGFSWKEISRRIPGRTMAACQTRWEIYYRETSSKYNKHRARTERRKALRDIPIFGGNYIFRVPDGDPYLQKLIKVHGNDTINRDYVQRKVA